MIPFFVAAQAWTATYYIDYEKGDDANVGTSTNAPWKRHPGMNGWSGQAFVTQPGDRFIFKGGITWPNAACSMYLTDDGTSENRIYVGIDTNWYSRVQFIYWTNGNGIVQQSFNYPIIDAEGLDIVDNRSFAGASNTRNNAVIVTGDYITIDGLCVKGVRIDDNPAGGSPNPDAGSDHTLRVHDALDFIGQGLYLCDWVVDTVHGGDVGGAIATGSCVNSALISCRIKGPENIDSKFITAINGRDYGNAVQFFSLVQGCDISRTGQGVWNCKIVESNVIHSLGQYTDSQTHENALWAQNSATINGNVFRDVVGLLYFMPGWGKRSNHTMVAFNNVFLNTPALRLNPQDNPDVSNELWFFNNVVKQSSLCLQVGTTKPGAPFAALVIQNNIFISDKSSNPEALVNLVDTSDFGSRYESSHNVYLSTAQANSLGLTTARLFKPSYQIPILAGQGYDLSSKTGIDMLGISRPHGGFWDIGPYQISGAHYAPAPPTDLRLDNSR